MKLAFLWAVFLIAFLGLCLAWCVPARAHSFYSALCCSDRDCHPVADTDVEATAGGWFVKPTGETIPYSDPKVKPSPDGRFHLCVPETLVRCIYTPGMGS